MPALVKSSRDVVPPRLFGSSKDGADFSVGGMLVAALALSGRRENEIAAVAAPVPAVVTLFKKSLRSDEEEEEMEKDAAKGMDDDAISIVHAAVMRAKTFFIALDFNIIWSVN